MALHEGIDLFGPLFGDPEHKLPSIFNLVIDPLELGVEPIPRAGLSPVHFPEPLGGEDVRGKLLLARRYGKVPGDPLRIDGLVEKDGYDRRRIEILAVPHHRRADYLQSGGGEAEGVILSEDASRNARRALFDRHDEPGRVRHLLLLSRDYLQQAVRTPVGAPPCSGSYGDVRWKPVGLVRGLQRVHHRLGEKNLDALEPVPFEILKLSLRVGRKHLEIPCEGGDDAHRQEQRDR